MLHMILRVMGSVRARPWSYSCIKVLYHQVLKVLNIDVTEIPIVSLRHNGALRGLAEIVIEMSGPNLGEFSETLPK